jgi:hypothetical protein
MLVALASCVAAKLCMAWCFPQQLPTRKLTLILLPQLYSSLSPASCATLHFCLPLLWCSLLPRAVC